MLLKAYDERGFVFYTHTHSQKGRELHDNPYAALLFLWRSLREVGIGPQRQAHRAPRLDIGHGRRLDADTQGNSIRLLHAPAASRS